MRTLPRLISQHRRSHAGVKLSPLPATHPQQPPVPATTAMKSSTETTTATSPGKTRSSAIKLIVFLLVAAAAAIGYWQFGDALTLDNLASKETALREAKANAPLLVFGIGFLIYVLVTGLSLPGAAVLTLASGWFFGLWQGTLLVSFASTTGATLAFLFSRYLFRDTIQRRFGDRLEKFNAALEKEGPFYLFTLRLIPVVPFFVINLVMGLTPIRTWSFWWVSQVGMLAGTVVYVYAGASVPSLEEMAERGMSGVLSPQVIIAFVVLGIFPITVKKIMARVRSRRETAEIARLAGAEVLQESRRGYGAACWRGLQQLPPSVRWILFCRADGCDDLSALGSFFHAGADGCDLILADRTSMPGNGASLTTVQRFGNRLAGSLIRLRWGARFHDLGPLRLVRRSSIEAMEMTDRGFGWTVEMQAKAAAGRFQCREIPVSYSTRMSGKSKIAGTISGSLKAGTVILLTLARLAIAKSDR